MNKCHNCEIIETDIVKKMHTNKQREPYFIWFISQVFNFTSHWSGTLSRDVDIIFGFIWCWLVDVMDVWIHTDVLMCACESVYKYINLREYRLFGYCQWNLILFRMQNWLFSVAHFQYLRFVRSTLTYILLCVCVCVCENLYGIIVQLSINNITHKKAVRNCVPVCVRS